MQIENGCLAVIVRAVVPENLGKTVTVGAYIGKVAGYKGTDRWEVNRPMLSIKGKWHRHVREFRLMRIDGHREPEIARMSEEEL